MTATDALSDAFAPVEQSPLELSKRPLGTRGVGLLGPTRVEQGDRRHARQLCMRSAPRDTRSQQW